MQNSENMNTLIWDMIIHPPWITMVHGLWFKKQVMCLCEIKHVCRGHAHTAKHVTEKQTKGYLVGLVPRICPCLTLTTSAPRLLALSLAFV